VLNYYKYVSKKSFFLLYRLQDYNEFEKLHNIMTFVCFVQIEGFALFPHGKDMKFV